MALLCMLALVWRHSRMVVVKQLKIYNKKTLSCYKEITITHKLWYQPFSSLSSSFMCRMSSIFFSFMLNLWFIMGYKTCRKQSMEMCQHKSCWQKAWDLVLKKSVSFKTQFLLHGMSLFNLHSCILFISIFVILTNVDTLITLYFYFCRWNLKKRKIIEAINKAFDQITQVMEVARALTTILVKNDDQYI